MYYGFSPLWLIYTYWNKYIFNILIGICPKDPTFNSTDSYSSMFIDALVTLSRKWKEISFSRWADNERAVHIHYGILFSCEGKNKILSFAAKWMELEKYTDWSNADKAKQMPHSFSLEGPNSKSSCVSTYWGVIQKPGKANMTTTSAGVVTEQ